MCGRIVIAAAMAGIILGACNPSRDTAATQTSSSASVTVKGSDTMVHLVTTWAEEYKKAMPSVDVSVTGGGSGTGISALINGGTDLCAASREMSPSEMEQAKGKGLDPKEIIVARDGIAVIVHPSNPLNELTLEQVKKVYTGANEEWPLVGGPQGKIIVLSRESSSGTYVFFQEHVLRKEDYTPRARLMPATSAIIQAVSEDVLAIGYVGLGYALEAAGRVKVLNIKADDAAPVITPTEASVRDGSYSIARPLYFYTSAAANEAANGFVQYCLGEAGQRIVREAGYVPVK